ncbi:MAG: hypothetical protein ACM3XO_19600 [Bacteroidota bacterium]
MKPRISRILSIAILLLYSLLTVQHVFAHGDDARIEVSPERLNPGSVLDVRGVDFVRDTEISLSLVGPQVELPLGTAIADAEGVFLLTYKLPADLAEGTYVVRGATDDQHAVDSPSFIVFGSADFGSADGELRQEDDGLLAPMPTLAAGVPTPQMASTSPPANLPKEEHSLPYAWIAAGIGVLAISFLVLKLRR